MGLSELGRNQNFKKENYKILLQDPMNQVHIARKEKEEIKQKKKKNKIIDTHIDTHIYTYASVPVFVLLCLYSNYMYFKMIRL